MTTNHVSDPTLAWLHEPSLKMKMYYSAMETEEDYASRGTSSADGTLLDLEQKCDCLSGIFGLDNVSNLTQLCENLCGSEATEVLAGHVTNSYEPSALFQAIIYTTYSVIFLVALVGNSFVCGVVLTSIRKWTVTNYFIANMAAGDILMALFCIPFTFVTTLVLLYWPFGAAMCRVVSFSQAVSVFVSAYTMVAISADRYLALVYPLRPRMTKRQAKILICLVWLAAVLTALPIAMVSELTVPDSVEYNGYNIEWYRVGNKAVCQERWYSPQQQRYYTIALLMLQYCIPLTLLVVLYGRIAFEVWGKKAPGEANQDRDLQIAKSKRNMIKMMIIVVIVFAICWLPLNMFQVLTEFYPEILYWQHIHYVLFACHWLAMSHSAYNPIIYCCFNSKFRQGFADLALRCGCGCFFRRRRHSGRRTAGRPPSTFSTCTYGPHHPQTACNHSKLPNNGQVRYSVRFSRAESEPLNPAKFVFRASFNQPQTNGRNSTLQRYSESQM